MQIESGSKGPREAAAGQIDEQSGVAGVESALLRLPADYRPFIDKYFLRTKEVLEAEGLNPVVRAQVVIRSSEGFIRGVDEAVAVIRKYSDLEAHGGRIFALKEGEWYDRNKAVLLIEGPIQDFVALETQYLGVMAAETTKFNDEISHVDVTEVERKTRAVVELIGGRPLMYFGARHWRYDEDAAISAAAFAGGAGMCSTDEGARAFGQKGMGTIPHVLENIMAWRYGKDRAVVEATKAFDRVIDPAVPRIALVDYANHEVDDSVATARELEGRLSAVRIDTCGENVGQGAFASAADLPAGHPIAAVLDRIPEPERRYWFGHGVTVSGVLAVRRALDAAGFDGVQIVLSSGFASAEKVAAFVRAEELLGVKLFDSLGVGGLWKPCRTTKMDVVAVANRMDDLDRSPMSKAGRSYRPNPNLKLAGTE